jgi:hypothetical protein
MNLTTMPTLGTTMSGGEIKMRRTLPPGGVAGAEIVLAFLPHNSVTPWATWQANPGDEYPSTFWGHYFRAGEEEEALADFMKRGR